MQAVGDLAGVHKVTVCRVLKGRYAGSNETVNRVLQACKALGYEPKPKREIPFSKDVYDMIQSGASDKEIIGKLSCSSVLVRQIRWKIRTRNWRPEPKPQKPKAADRLKGNEQQIRQMKQAGVSYARIAVHFDVSEPLVIKLLQGRRGDKCEHCGTTRSLHAHHVNYITNECKTLCSGCHLREHREIVRMASITS